MTAANEQVLTHRLDQATGINQMIDVTYVSSNDSVDHYQLGGRIQDYARIDLFFHRGRPGEKLNGVTNEAVLAALIHRLGLLNRRQACVENEGVIWHLEHALMLLQKREQRVAQAT